MTGGRFFDKARRKIIVTGHYGSGKTEFAVSLAMLLAARNTGKLALVDLDIVNPYFRSREQRDMLEHAGVSVYGSAYDSEITLELPALGSTVRAPLENPDCRVIIDVGGDDSGALVLNQYRKYLTDNDTTVLTVVNANRPETRYPEGALRHISAIEYITGLTITGIVNNSHMLRETTAEMIVAGHGLCGKICKETDKELWCDCYPDGIVDPDDLKGISGTLMPLGLYMRPTWLD